MNSLLSQAELRSRCEEIIRELHGFTVMIENHLHIRGLAKRIDTFFYMEANNQLMRFYDQLDYCWEIDSKLCDKIEAIQSLIRTQWQKDYMLIACPASLHPYLMV